MAGATTKAGCVDQTGLWWQPWEAENQPALQGYKPTHPIGETQKQGVLSSKSWEHGQGASPGGPSPGETTECSVSSLHDSFHNLGSSLLDEQVDGTYSPRSYVLGTSQKAQDLQAVPFSQLAK